MDNLPFQGAAGKVREKYPLSQAFGVSGAKKTRGGQKTAPDSK